MSIFRENATHAFSYPDSYYANSMEYSVECAQLCGAKKADVCVIGGGFTGVSTALELSQLGYQVIVLEAFKMGWGASGRNGGQLVRGLGDNIKQFQSVIGEEGVKSIHNMAFDSVELVKKRIRDDNIQCDLSMGYIDAALNLKHLSQLRKEYEHLQSHKLDAGFLLLNQDELEQYVGTSKYMGGLVDSNSGHLHPLNLLLAEVLLAKDKGVDFFEYSKVNHIEYADRPVVKTRFGSVECDFVVVACNAYLNNLVPQLNKQILPASSYIIATEPLSEDFVQEVLPKNHAVCDTGIALDYFRLSADRRLLFGGTCYYTGRDVKNIRKILHKKMLHVFPQLNSINIDFHWGGYLGIGANRMPQIGRLNDCIYYAQAYSGHGLNVAHLAGKILADVINKQSQEFDVFAKIKHSPFPGGQYFNSEILALGMLWLQLKEWF